MFEKLMELVFPPQPSDAELVVKTINNNLKPFNVGVTDPEKDQQFYIGFNFILQFEDNDLRCQLKVRDDIVPMFIIDDPEEVAFIRQALITKFADEAVSL